MTRPIRGSCQCGAITFEATGPFDGFFLCHCARCRKDTGSAHAANLFSATGRLTWLSGEADVRMYRVPETRHVKSFCPACGSAVPTAIEDGAGLLIPAGALDDMPDIRPTAHLCWADRAAWDADLETVPRLDGLPG
ncbi:GFA family protein [Chachezhania sediminis]|uniref:GFA family protein n=1 Tax=Chachezhania sediminis TaxID=2599291 RepID=UPI00131A7745|nr:GFA family protein [Chachezhania sediminis]